MPVPAPRADVRPFEVASPFGTRVDPYYWLRDDDRQNPAVLGYLEAENAYREAATAHLRPLEERLYGELISRLRQDDSSVPVRYNGWWYYQRFETGSEYAIHARRADVPTAPEQVLVDGNVEARARDFYELGACEVSPNNRILAVAEDVVGRRQYTVQFRDLETGEVYPERIENVEADLVWAGDSRTILYVAKDPETLLGNRVLRHVLGTPVTDDVLVYEEADEAFYLGIDKSKSDRHLYIVSQSTVSTEYRYADTNDPALAFRIVIPRERDHEYQLEDLGDRFVIRTNWQAKNFRIVTVPVAQLADRSAWRDEVAHHADTFVSGFDVFRDYLVVNERSGGLRKIRVRAWGGAREFMIDAAEPAYTMGLGANEEFDSTSLRYVYSSLTTPNTTYDYDMVTGAQLLLKRDPVLGDFDPAYYATEFVWAPARDGARVPVSLLYRKGYVKDGSAPLYQYAYGAYGLSQDPAFRSTILSLVDRGVVYAIAHVRGGEELGRAWYDDGRLAAKQNTFNDFVDVTRFLVAGRYVDGNRVAAMGGSAGGLLIGVIANQTPDDYRALVAHVPFVDIVTTMLDESIPLTTNEYDEWGNPAADRATYERMLAYSPYDNVVRRAHPAMLVTTGLWDSQVQYWEPAKWVARLRAVATGDRALLLRTHMEAGHGGKSGRFQRYREIAEEYAFVIDQLALNDSMEPNAGR